MASFASLTAEQREVLSALGIDVAAFISKSEPAAGSQSKTVTEDPTETKVPSPQTDLEKENEKSAEPEKEEDDCIMVEHDTAEPLASDASLVVESAKKKRKGSEVSSAVRRSSRNKKQMVKKKAAHEEDDGRNIVPDLVLEEQFLETYRLTEVISLLKENGWENLFEKEVLINVDLLKEFYEHFSVEERPDIVLGSFTVKGETHTITSRELGLFLNVPHHGYGEYIKGQWPSSVDPEEIIGRVGKDVKQMSLVTRIVHRIVSQRITPRLQKHNVVNFHDYILMDKILMGEQINLPMQILQHMAHSSTISKHGLPYPGFVKIILQKFGLYKAKKEVPAFIKFELENCSRLGFRFDEETGWMKKADIPVLLPKEEPTPVIPVPATPVPAIPVPEITEVLEVLKGLTEKVDGMLPDQRKMIDKIKSLEESVGIGLVHQSETKERLNDLTSALNKFGTGALEEMRKAIRR